jgi:ABC-type antimicrobial peptide transport system permease subunit
VFDLIAQIWLSATRRALAYSIAVVSLSLGVAAFVCLGALSQSFTTNLTYRVTLGEQGEGSSLEMGPTIRVEVGTKRPRLDVQSVHARVVRALARDVGAMTTGRYDVKLGRHALRDMQVVAVSSEWLRLQPHFWAMEETIEGRLFSPDDDRSGAPVCIIDERLAHAFADHATPVGQMVSVNGRPFHIVGVVRQEAWNPGLLLISFPAAYPLFRIQPPDRVSFLMGSGEEGIESKVNEVQSAISGALGADYVVVAGSPWLELEATRDQIGYMRLLLGLVSLLPLVVGLLAMVSMLLANLNTRVREIGLHRALGATRPRQASLVLCEAGIAGLLAAAAGVPLGMAVLRLVASAWGTDLHLPPGGAALALVSCAATSLLAGLIPARAAMRVSPCDALRAE